MRPLCELQLFAALDVNDVLLRDNVKDRWESINVNLSRCCLYARIYIFFLASSLITNKHRTYVPRPTDGGSNPVVGVIYSAEEELLDSEHSAHERPLSGTHVSVSVITDEASRYHQDQERAIRPCRCSALLNRDVFYCLQWLSLKESVSVNLHKNLNK